MWMETMLPAEFKVLFLDSIFVILWYLWLFFRARIANEKRLLAKRYRSERKKDRWQEWLKNLARQKRKREVECQIVPLQQGQTIPKTFPGLY